MPNRALQSALEHVNGSESEAIQDTRDVVDADQTSRVCRQIVNDFLSELNLAILDNLGVAFLPTNKLPSIYQADKINMLMILEAPESKPTLQLYTHFTKSRDKVTPNSDDENRVLNKLLQSGRHNYKSLTLKRICDERLRFCFQVQKHEITSTDGLRTIFEMFVKVGVHVPYLFSLQFSSRLKHNPFKVSRRLKKKIECDGISG